MVKKPIKNRENHRPAGEGRKDGPFAQKGVMTRQPKNQKKNDKHNMGKGLFEKVRSTNRQKKKKNETVPMKINTKKIGDNQGKKNKDLGMEGRKSWKTSQSPQEDKGGKRGWNQGGGREGKTRARYKEKGKRKIWPMLGTPKGEEMKRHDKLECRTGEG